MRITENFAEDQLNLEIDITVQWGVNLQGVYGRPGLNNQNRFLMYITLQSYHRRRGHYSS